MLNCDVVAGQIPAAAAKKNPEMHEHLGIVSYHIISGHGLGQSFDVQSKQTETPVLNTLCAVPAPFALTPPSHSQTGTV